MRHTQKYGRTLEQRASSPLELARAPTSNFLALSVIFLNKYLTWGLILKIDPTVDTRREPVSLSSDIR